MFAALPALAVSTIYLSWNVCHQERLRREQLLRERVAYMLWVAAHQDDYDEGDAADDSEVDYRC